MAEAGAKATVYVETTVVSYLTAWPSRDVVRLSHEILTRQWWNTDRASFDLRTSVFVIDEASAGDRVAAAERLEALRDVPLLAVTEPVAALAARPADALALPERARVDAAHVAVAAVHATDYLLTWNCRHLANAALAARIERTCAAAGFAAPRIVTPETLRATS